MDIKRRKLVSITYAEFCHKYKMCKSCPEYNKEQHRCCITTELRVAENADYINQNGHYVFRVKIRVKK